MAFCVVRPLDTLEQLLHWEQPAEETHKQIPDLPSSYEGLPERRLTVVCHDYRGGYAKDNVDFVSDPQSCVYEQDYMLFHWDKCDMFIYFSHHFITIPPVGWIAAAHRNSTPVLGTFITEHDAGAKLCDEMFGGNKDTCEKVADKMVEIARFYKLSGWLINIENQMNPNHISTLLHFLEYLRLKLREAAERDGRRVSHLMWYDSVCSDDGKLLWQNELNDANKLFYSVCDSIYLNYGWNPKRLENSKALALAIKQEKGVVVGGGDSEEVHDVFVGVDIFGRGCYGGGEFQSDVAVQCCEAFDLSVALFAPGWTKEVSCSSDPSSELCFFNRDLKLWNALERHLPGRSPTCVDLPMYTEFNCGLTQSGAGEVLMCLYEAQIMPSNALNFFRKNYELAGEPLVKGILIDFKEGTNEVIWLQFSPVDRLSVEVKYKFHVPESNAEGTKITREMFLIAEISFNGTQHHTVKEKMMGAKDVVLLVAEKEQTVCKEGFNQVRLSVLCKDIDGDVDSKQHIEGSYVTIESIRVF